MDARRKKRVAAAPAPRVEEINRLLKMHLQMAGMMKQMGPGQGMFGKMMGGGKGAPDAAELERMQAELANLNPDALPEELKEMMKGGALPQMPGLPGLGSAKLPGLADCRGLAADRPSRVSGFRQEEVNNSVYG